MALKGRHLKVGANRWVPWVYLQENNDGSLALSGLTSTYFNIIAQKLNFTYSIYAPPDKEFGRELPNGSFTGLFGMTQRKEVDLLLGPVAQNYERFKVADFSFPVYTDPFRILLPMPRLESDLSSVTRPFTEEVWLALATTLCLSIILTLILKYFLNGRIQPISSRWKGEFDADVDPSSIVRILLSEVVTTLPTSETGRIFLATWMIGSIILQVAYSGVLTSILAVPKLDIPVDSLQDLLTYGKIPWIMKRGTILHHIMSKAESGVHKDIVDNAHYMAYVQEAKGKVKNEGMAMIASLFTLQKIIDEDFGATGECHYYIGKEIISPMLLCFGFPKGSELLEHFNNWVAPLKESGIIRHNIKAAVANASLCSRPPGQGTGNSKMVFSIMDMAGVFLVLAAGLLTGFLAFITELLFHR